MHMQAFYGAHLRVETSSQPTKMDSLPVAEPSKMVSTTGPSCHCTSSRTLLAQRSAAGSVRQNRLAGRGLGEGMAACRAWRMSALSRVCRHLTRSPKSTRTRTCSPVARAGPWTTSRYHATRPQKLPHLAERSNMMWTTGPRSRCPNKLTWQVQRIAAKGASGPWAVGRGPGVRRAPCRALPESASLKACRWAKSHSGITTPTSCRVCLAPSGPSRRSTTAQREVL
mmetsp:Transcript_47460/g.109865  ORF Transcript_47460/g.109865 Transcript_47460/m.109865 type:complete len:226 (+) Transcript_47460:858-1535(+)